MSMALSIGKTSKPMIQESIELSSALAKPEAVYKNWNMLIFKTR